MNAQTRDLLRWLELEPRDYGEAIEVWRTTCPQQSIWEDAIEAGLIEVVRNGAGAQVVVTAAGRTALAP